MFAWYILLKYLILTNKFIWNYDFKDRSKLKRKCSRENFALLRFICCQSTNAKLFYCVSGYNLFLFTKRTSFFFNAKFTVITGQLTAADKLLMKSKKLWNLSVLCQNFTKKFSQISLILPVLVFLSLKRFFFHLWFDTWRINNWAKPSFQFFIKMIVIKASVILLMLHLVS